MFDIYGIGNAIVDRIFAVEEQSLSELGLKKGQMSLITALTDLPHLDTLIAKQSLAAGSVANALFASAKAQAKVAFSGKVGADDLGNSYIQQLNNAGIMTPFGGSPDKETGQCMVFISPDAERTMATYLATSAEFGPADICERTLQNSHWLLIEGYLLFNETGFEAVKKAIKLAKKHQKKIAFSVADPAVASVCAQPIKELLASGLDCIACNSEEAQIISNTPHIKEQLAFLAQHANTVVITQGAEGAWAQNQKKQFFEKGLAVKAIDTVGAGDAFLGNFLASFHLENNIQTALAKANQAAAAIVQIYGARAADLV